MKHITNGIYIIFLNCLVCKFMNCVIFEQFGINREHIERYNCLLSQDRSPKFNVFTLKPIVLSQTKTHTETQKKLMDR